MGCTSVFCRWPYAGYTGVCELGLPHGARSFWAQRPARPLAPLLRHSLNYSTRVCQIALTIQVACLHPALCTSCWQPAVFFKKTRAVWNRASRGFNESMNSDWFVAKDSEKLFSSLVSLFQFFSKYSSSLSLSLSHWENRTKSWVVLRLRADKILGQCSIHLKKSIHTARFLIATNSTGNSKTNSVFSLRFIFKPSFTKTTISFPVST